MQQLDPQVGWAMAERLASDLAARTGTPVPQGVPSAAYLASVVQERQAREVRRAFANGSAAGGPAVGGQPVGAARPAGVPGSYVPPAGFPPVVTPPPAAHVEQAPAVGRQAEAPTHEVPAYGAPPTEPQDAQSADRPATGASGTTEPTGFVPPA